MPKLPVGGVSTNDRG